MSEIPNIKSDSLVERISSLFAILCTLSFITDKYFERFNVFRKENESCDKQKELVKEEEEEAILDSGGHLQT